MHYVDYFASRDNSSFIKCTLKLLVLDGMDNSQIKSCETQGSDDFLEWQLVVNDHSFTVAKVGSQLETHAIDIQTARFVPRDDKFHTDCYAKIAFESGQSGQEGVSWLLRHVAVLVVLVVGVALLFCCLVAALVVLWRQQRKMKQFMRADTYDKDEETDELSSLDEAERIVDCMPRASVNTVEIGRTTPGSDYLASVKGMRTSFEYDLKKLNQQERVKGGVESSESESESERREIVRKHERRPSILGITPEDLKLMKGKGGKESVQLLNVEWECESERSQNL